MTATAGSRTRDDELAGVDGAGNTGFVNGARFAPLLRLPPGSLAQSLQYYCSTQYTVVHSIL